MKERTSHDRREFCKHAAAITTLGLLSPSQVVNASPSSNAAHSELVRLSAGEMADRLKRNEFSPVELIEAHVTQFVRIQRNINAVSHTTFAAALRSARAAEKAIVAGNVDWESQPLFGVPFSVKNHIDVEGVPTTAGAQGWKHRIAESDADVVARLRKCGAIPICTTNLPCLALAHDTDNSLFGRTLNPYAANRSAGGSSGGEGALIAACGSPLGIGSDHNGSIRVPCAWNGLAGLRPSPGRISLAGMEPAVPIEIQEEWAIGPMARRVRDLEISLPFFTKQRKNGNVPPLRDSRRVKMKEMKIRFLKTWRQGSGKATPDIQEGVIKSVSCLEQSGAHVGNELPASFYRIGRAVVAQMVGSDNFSVDEFQKTMKAIGCENDHVLIAALDWIRRYQASVPIQNQRRDVDVFSSLQKEFATLMESVDAIVLPVHAQPAMPNGTVWPNDRDDRGWDKYSYCYFGMLRGQHPAGTVRVGTAAGLPVGVQIIGRRYRDDIVLRIMAELEAKFGGWMAPPNI